MFTALIAVVAALVLGHVAPGPVAGLRRFRAYRSLVSWLGNGDRNRFWSGRYGIVLALLPFVLLTALLQCVLTGPFIGLLGLLFAVLILTSTWGPRDLDRDVARILNSRTPDARASAIHDLLPDEPLAHEGASVLAGAVVRSALRRWFGVLFWFLVLGPAGAVLYRLTALVAADRIWKNGIPPQNLAGSRHLLALLEWPVAQLMTFSLALVGNFDAVLTAWRQTGGGSASLSGAYLEAAVIAAVKRDLAEEAEEVGPEDVDVVEADLPDLRDAMSLMWRTLLLWLAGIAILVIAGWVG